MPGAFGPGFSPDFGPFSAGPSGPSGPTVGPTVGAMFADVEALLVDYLETTTGVRTVTSLPAQLETALPVFRVTGVGGADDRVTDRTLVEVEAFAAQRGDARDLAETARQAMLAAAHTELDGWLVDTVQTESRPRWVDYANERVQRFLAMYGVATRVR